LKEGLEFLGSLYKDKSRRRLSPDKITPGARNTLDALFAMPSGMSAGIDSFVLKKKLPLKDLRRQQREGLKSATAKEQYKVVIKEHNKQHRLQSAKPQVPKHVVKAKKAAGPLKDKIYDYEHYQEE